MADPTRRQLLHGAAALTASGFAAGVMAQQKGGRPTPAPFTPQDETIDLWPASPPGARGTAMTLHVDDRSRSAGRRDRAVNMVAQPLLAVRRPARPDGSAVLVIPGGGYRFLSWDNEGEEQAAWLTARGATVFILRYRLPSEGWDGQALVPLQDAQRAVRLIRAGAGRYGVDPARIAVLGFSAGGHLGGSLATRHAEAAYRAVDVADKLSARPDYAGLIYPVINLETAQTHAGSRDLLLGPNQTAEARRTASVDRRVDAQTPPIFLAHAADDRTVPIVNSIALYQAMLGAARPVEFHGFDTGGHGFGVRLDRTMPASVWPDLFHAYGRRLGVFGDGTGVTPPPR